MPSFFPSLRRLHFVLTVGCAVATLLTSVRADSPQTVVELQTLYTFRGTGDGSLPYGGLVAGGDGFFYGTTSGGGTDGRTGGSLFRLAPDGTLVTLSSFLAGAPTSTLTVGIDGGFYGTATLGGQDGDGFVFRTSASGSTRITDAFTTSTTGAAPYAGLLQGSDGGFYGTTTRGAGSTINGTVFQFKIDGSLRVLHAFKIDNSEGTLPYGVLAQGRDGDYYGTTSANGPRGGGTVFKVNILGFFSTVYAFSGGADGGSPRAALLVGSDGNFYGTTVSGGSTNGGTIFRLTPQGVLTTLHSFDASASEGIYPNGPLLDGGDGSFYGTTSAGGTSNKGSIFAVTAAGAFQTVYSFTGGKDGAQPYGALASGGSGIFYGTTSMGGLNNQSRGTAFLLNLHALPNLPGTLALSAATTNVSESVSIAKLTVNRTGGSTGAVSVGYTTADGSAKAGVDFLAVSGRLSWAAGDTSAKTISVPVSNPGISDDSTRTFSVRLLTTTGSAALGTSSETVNILEDDAVQPTTVTLSVLGDGMAVVGGKNGKVLFTRSGDTTDAITVAYQLKGKPVNGSDYQFLPGVLNIPAGASSAKLKIKPNAGAGHRGTSNIRIIPLAPVDGSYVVEPDKVKIRFVHN